MTREGAVCTTLPACASVRGCACVCGACGHGSLCPQPLLSRGTHCKVATMQSVLEGLGVELRVCVTRDSRKPGGGDAELRPEAHRQVSRQNNGCWGNCTCRPQEVRGQEAGEEWAERQPTQAGDNRRAKLSRDPPGKGRCGSPSCQGAPWPPEEQASVEKQAVPERLSWPGLPPTSGTPPLPAQPLPEGGAKGLSRPDGPKPLPWVSREEAAAVRRSCRRGCQPTFRREGGLLPAPPRTLETRLKAGLGAEGGAWGRRGLVGRVWPGT